MNSQLLEFADILRKHSDALGATPYVEWKIDKAPIAYPEALAAMEERVAAIAEGRAPELIWFLEHPPLYTAGTSAKPSDLLDPGRFPVFQAGRGGQYTYHGPGQLVAYVMFDLNRRGRDVRLFVHRLEGWVMAALAECGVEGFRREGRPGIWVAHGAGRHPDASALVAGGIAEAKIAAIGVRVRRWVTFHGVAINICPDLSHFTGIVPCGIGDAGVTSLQALQPSPRVLKGMAEPEINFS